MRSFSFEPGDGSSEVTVDHPNEITEEDIKSPSTTILLNFGSTYKILKNTDERLTHKELSQRVKKAIA